MIKNILFCLPIMLWACLCIYTSTAHAASQGHPATGAQDPNKAPVHIGILVYPGVYQIDVTAPYGVFAAAPNAQVHLIWQDTAPITSSDGLILTPTTTFANCPPLDVICVPGGAGLFPLLKDTETLAFLHAQAASAKYVTSVCTGSLLLAAVGGLDGYKATTHWHAQPLLEAFGVTFVGERVVVDKNRITGAGVSAGLDLALTVVSKIWGESVAQDIELTMEYDPRPPFHSGHPSIAPKEAVERLNTRMAPHMPARQKEIEDAAKRLREKK